MSESQHLFTLPIASYPPNSEKDSESNIVCTQTPSENGPVYLLTITYHPDNRLTTPLLQTLLLALDILEYAYPHGVVVTTSGIPKFYSNGLDLDHLRDTPNFFSQCLFVTFRKLLTYPMPTVALMNGHAFAGGCILAMYHDYRVMNSSRGFCCLNELDFGAKLHAAMSSIFRQKLSHDVYKVMVLEARRFSGQQALERGIVDKLGDFSDVLKLVEERDLAAKPSSGIYGTTKAEMYRETLNYIDGYDEEEEKSKKLSDANKIRERIERERVEAWQHNASLKAKL